MSLDMYSEKVADASSLIRKHAGTEYFHYFQGDPERALEQFIAMLDQAEEKGRQAKAARISDLERELAEHKAARIAYASEFPSLFDEPDVGSIHANIRKLKIELAELRKDAERYRFLRNIARHFESPLVPIVVMMNDAGDVVGDDIDAHGIRDGKYLDAAIDAAMSTPNKGESK